MAHIDLADNEIQNTVPDRIQLHSSFTYAASDAISLIIIFTRNQSLPSAQKNKYRYLVKKGDASGTPVEPKPMSKHPGHKNPAQSCREEVSYLPKRRVQ